MKVPFAIDNLWAGTQASLDSYQEIEARIAERLAAGSGDPTEEGDTPYLLDVQGNVGVIKVAGPLTNSDSWLNRYFGATSYSAIREALMHAASDPAIQHIVLDINSGGGAVNGVSDTGNLIRLVNDRVKPVTAYSDGGMLSAAYWLGSSAGKVYSSNVSQVGSIGIIATHVDRSQALKDAGMKVTVMRAGEFKALANPNEPLTDPAKAQIQNGLDAAYKVFVQHVADHRGQPYGVADATMAQGREFFGQQAADAGLVDGIMSFDDLMSKIQAEAPTSTPRTHYQGNAMTKKALTDAAIAAITAGVTLTAVGAGSGDAAADAAAAALLAASQVDASAQTEADKAAAKAAAEAAAALAATAEAERLAAAATAKEKSDNAVITYLQGQISDLNAAVTNYLIEIAGFKTKITDMEASHTALLEIAGKSLSAMQVALGGTAVKFEGMTASQVLAEHQRVSGVFQEKFKAGGVAAVDTAEASNGDVEADANTLALHAARVAATKPTARK